MQDHATAAYFQQQTCPGRDDDPRQPARALLPTSHVTVPSGHRARCAHFYEGWVPVGVLDLGLAGHSTSGCHG